MPHINIPGSAFFAFAGKPDFNAVARNHVVVVQRMYAEAQFEFLRASRALGLRIVYDIDDDVWDLPEYNPAHKELTRQREGFNACIRMTDVVSVSTKTLAKVLKRNVKFMVNASTGKQIPVIVAENRIDERLFSDPVGTPDKVIVGWAGSSSHVGDLLLVEKAILVNAAERPDVTFQFRGCKVADGSPLSGLKNFEHRLWSPVPEFAARMPQWGWSIALAPVTEHPFNDSKSAIKAIEAAYCGIPCLMSWVRPYEEFTWHEKELRWLLCQTDRQWTEKIRELINDPDRCRYLGQLSKKVAMDLYSYRKPHEGWAEVLEAAIE